MTTTKLSIEHRPAPGEPKPWALLRDGEVVSRHSTRFYAQRAGENLGHPEPWKLAPATHIAIDPTLPLSAQQADIVKLGERLASKGDAAALRLLMIDTFRVGAITKRSLDVAIRWHAVGAALEAALGLLIDAPLAKALDEAQAAFRFNAAPTQEQRAAYRRLVNEALAKGMLHDNTAQGMLAEVDTPALFEEA